MYHFYGNKRKIIMKRFGQRPINPQASNIPSTSYKNTFLLSAVVPILLIYPLVVKRIM